MPLMLGVAQVSEVRSQFLCTLGWSQNVANKFNLCALWHRVNCSATRCCGHPALNVRGRNKQGHNTDADADTNAVTHIQGHTIQDGKPDLEFRFGPFPRRPGFQIGCRRVDRVPKSNAGKCVGWETQFGIPVWAVPA